MQLLIKTLHDLFTTYIGWTVAIIVVWAVIAAVLIRKQKEKVKEMYPMGMYQPEIETNGQKRA